MYLQVGESKRCVRGGLEHTGAGNFPNSGKFPWVKYNGQVTAGARYFVLCAGSRAWRTGVPWGECVAESGGKVSRVAARL